MIPLSPPGIQTVKLIQSAITKNNTKTTCTVPSFDLWVKLALDNQDKNNSNNDFDDDDIDDDINEYIFLLQSCAFFNHV
jgi:hypothetical protein